MIEQQEPHILKINDPVRVRMNGANGLVERISPALRKAPILVRHQNGSRAYSPAELLYTGNSAFPQPCAVAQEVSGV